MVLVGRKGVYGDAGSRGYGADGGCSGGGGGEAGANVGGGGGLHASAARCPPASGGIRNRVGRGGEGGGGGVICGCRAGLLKISGLNEGWVAESVMGNQSY